MPFGAGTTNVILDDMVSRIGVEVERINKEVGDILEKNKVLQETKNKYEKALKDVGDDAKYRLAARLAQARRRLERVQRMFGDDAARYMFGDAMYNEANPAKRGVRGGAGSG